MANPVTNDFPVPINKEISFNQSNFTGANYGQDERPILNIKFGIIYSNQLPGLQGYYYLYNITFNDAFNQSIKVYFATNVEPGTSQGDRVPLRGDNTPGITMGILPNSGFNETLGFGAGGTLRLMIKFGTGVPISNCSYKTDDQYVFTTSTSFLYINPTMNIQFIRSNQTNSSDLCIPQKSLFFNKNIDTNIPSININFQSLIDGSDIGNTIFKITDDIEYYNHKTKQIFPSYNCKIISTNNPKITIFTKSCPLIVLILQGIGNTAWEKTRYLFINMITNVNDIYNFFINLVKFSMTKYLLSRIMYGKFNIKFVLNQYNSKFIKDLKNTRFCKYVDLFINPSSNIFGYEQYFL